MNFTSIVFTLAIAILLFWIFTLKMRSNSLNNKAFRALPKEAALAVLKDRLLNAPTIKNLQNLVHFAKELGLTVNENDYMPLLKKQTEISSLKNALEEDSILFEKEAKFLDSITPPEVLSANKAKETGDTDLFIDFSLDAVMRFYSDEKIEDLLSKLIPYYPRAKDLLESYIELKTARDNSGADEESLKILRDKRNAWYASLKNA